MAEVDDRVVDEMPVFLSKSFVDNLYLFQYPVRSGNVSYDDVNYLRARMKPVQQKVEIELGLNTRSSSYDKGQGQLLANILEDSLMDKHVLSSTLAVPRTSRYAVACLKDGELHVNSLHGVVQLRPAFTYLDRDDSKRDKNDAEEDVAQQITVKFARPDNDKSKKAREKSFRLHQQIMADEAWMDVSFSTMEKSKITNKKLICHREDQHGIPELHVSDRDYLRNLIPIESNPSVSSDSLLQLRTLSLSDQIKAIVLNANVISFWQLLSLLPRGIESNSVIQLAQHVAILVQGNWVVKSDLLFPKQTRSSHSGLGAEVLANGRDYVLWNFSKARFVNRKEMASVTKLPSEDLKEILEAVSKCRQTKGWEFLLPLDTAFIDKYPDVAQRQQMLWNTRFQQPTKSLKLTTEKFRE